MASSPRTPVPGAVSMPTKPKPLRFPVKSEDGHGPSPRPACPRAEEEDRVQPEDEQAAQLDSASQIVYANADGTKTAFDFQQPVNYQASDGQWVTANPSLVADDPSASAAPSAYTTAPGVGQPRQPRGVGYPSDLGQRGQPNRSGQPGRAGRVREG